MTKKNLSMLILMITLVFVFASCAQENEVPEEPFVEVGVEGLEYVLDTDETMYAVKSIGTCNIKEIVLPTEYQGKPVTTILWGAFKNSNIEKITIPDGYTIIYESAFEGCAALTSVTLPNTLKVINNAAFYKCSSLKEIKIPDSITTMGQNVFKDCTALESLELSINLENFSTTMFENTPVYANNTVLVDGIKYFDCFIVEVLQSSIPENLVIRENTREIPSNAFKDCKNLKTVTLPDGLKGIGNCAFWGCANLEQIIIPDSVKYIGDNAFANTSKLKTEVYDNCVYVGNHLIDTTIESDYKYHNSISVREGTVTVSLTFPFFEGVGTFNFPASVEYISLDFMRNDISVRNINVHNDNKNYTSIDGVLYNKDVTELLLCPRKTGTYMIPNTVVKIAESAFTYGLVESGEFIIIVPKSVKEVAFDGFRGVATEENVKVFLEATAEESPQINGVHHLKRYYYSETDPTSEYSDYKDYWHYVDGVPTIWE